MCAASRLRIEPSRRDFAPGNRRLPRADLVGPLGCGAVDGFVKGEAFGDVLFGLFEQPAIAGGIRTSNVLSITPMRPDNFGFEWTGYLHVATAGNYAFELGSDDGSLLELNGPVAINNDGNHGYLTVVGLFNLQPGL